MSRFYVGQGVVKVAIRRGSRSPSRPTGAVGTVMGFAADGDICVGWDDGSVTEVAPYQIEPIDDSRELTTWAACVWQPKQVRAVDGANANHWLDNLT